MKATALSNLDLRPRPSKRRKFAPRRPSSLPGMHKQLHREGYYAALIRFQAWCEERGRCFYIELCNLARRAMGELLMARPVMRLSDRRIFPSARAAARAVGRSNTSIRKAIINRRRCRGSLWIFVEMEDAA